MTARRGFLKALMAAGAAPLVLTGHKGTVAPAPEWISPDAHFRFTEHEDGSVSITLRKVGDKPPRIYLKQAQWTKDSIYSRWDWFAECGGLM